MCVYYLTTIINLYYSIKNLYTLILFLMLTCNLDFAIMRVHGMSAVLLPCLHEHRYSQCSMHFDTYHIVKLRIVPARVYNSHYIY